MQVALISQRTQGTSPPHKQKRKGIGTKEFAQRFLVQPDTVRRSLCLNGHYCGIVPEKLPNGRLLWPDEDEA